MSDIIGATHRPIYGEGSSAPHVDKSTSTWAIKQGYKIRFTHTTGHTVEFPGNIIKFTDSHKAENDIRYIQDDQNPIFTTKWTARQISFTLSLANASLDEARYNAQNINLLICMMYPTFDTSDKRSDLPVVYCRGLSFVQATARSPEGVGLYINDLTYSPNIDAGFITSKGTGIRGEDEIYPAQIDIVITADCIIPGVPDDDALASPFPDDYPRYY